MATKNTVGVRVLDYPSFRRELEELKKAQQVAAVARGKSRKEDLWFADKEAKVRCLKTKQSTGVKYKRVNEHYRLVDDDDVDNPLDLMKKHGDLIVLPNEFVWVVLLLKFAVFIHDPKNACLTNTKLIDAFIKNMGTKYYFLKEWTKARLFVEGETTVPVSVPTEPQQQQLLKQLLGAYCRGNEQEFNHLLVSAGLPCPVPMLHNNNNNNNFLARSLSPGVASAPIHATAAFSSQIGQHLVLPGVRRSFGTSLNNAPYYASIMSGAPFQQHPPVASLRPSNNYYNINRREIAQTSTGKILFNVAPGNCYQHMLKETGEIWESVSGVEELRFVLRCDNAIVVEHINKEGEQHHSGVLVWSDDKVAQPYNGPHPDGLTCKMLIIRSVCINSELQSQECTFLYNFWEPDWANKVLGLDRASLLAR